jgi:hypothetical protein
VSIINREASVGRSIPVPLHTYFALEPLMPYVKECSTTLTVYCHASLSPQSTMATSQTSSPFLRLPTEIRLQIYAYVLTCPDPLSVYCWRRYAPFSFATRLLQHPRHFLALVRLVAPCPPPASRTPINSTVLPSSQQPTSSTQKPTLSPSTSTPFFSPPPTPLYPGFPASPLPNS